MYKILLSRKAEKSLQKIPKEYIRRLKKSIIALADNPRGFGVIKISSASKADQRLRVGNYRIIFKIDDKKNIVIVADIKRRATTTYRY